MTRQDWMTHLALAIGFLVLLGPLVAVHTFTFGSGVYLSGVAAQLIFATTGRLRTRE
jgi:hypothetical protein